jgi:parvulin-like peptidyl-prolyl isomerase
LAMPIFGALLVLLFAIVAIAEGIGSPSIPSGAIAKIEEVPSAAQAPYEGKKFKDCNGKLVEQDLSVVTDAEFECTFKQLAAGSDLKTPPKPGDEQYDVLRERTITTLIEGIWLQSLAVEEGITITVREVKEEEAKLIKKEFAGNKKKFEEFLKTFGYTEQEAKERLETEALGHKLAKPLEEKAAAAPSSSEISDAYEAEKATRFTKPETRDIRILISKDKKKVEEGKAALEKDDSAKNWKKVIEKYAESPAAAPSGGLQPGVTEEQYVGPVGEAMFSTSKGELVGPLKYTLGEVVFEVEKTTPEEVRPLGEAEAEIKTELGQKSKEAIFTGYIEDFSGKWRARTFCASGFTIEKTCSNFDGTPKIEGESPSCRGEEETKAEKEAATPETEGCPAPVLQSKPALPGTITIVAPKGTQLAQRPYPPGLESAEAPPSLGGLIPSEVPTSP